MRAALSRHALWSIGLCGRGHEGLQLMRISLGTRTTITNVSMNRDQLSAGALYALQHAGDLLRDAATLFDRGGYSSTALLAVRCREELGRYRVLLEQFARVELGESLAPARLRSKLADHVTKLRKGQIGVTLRMPPSLGTRYMEAMTNPRSPEFAAIRAEIDRLVRAKASRDPHDVHRLRLRADYVDFTDAGKWSRPRDVSREEVWDLLAEVAGDYLMHQEDAFTRQPLTKLLSEQPEEFALAAPSFPSAARS